MIESRLAQHRAAGITGTQEENIHGLHDTPPQQFSVKNPIRPFMAAISAE
jgi:hypothetical protein